MSDMEQSDVVEPTPVAETAAPAEAPAETPDIQDSAAVQEPEVEPEAEAPQPEPVPVDRRTPSSESPTQQPEAAPEAEAPIPLADAARALIIFVKAHRTAGDSDLEAAVADVEAAISAQDA